MNIKNINEGELGYSLTVITISGNKLQGTILKTSEDAGVLKLKTEKGIVMINFDAIESIY